MFALSIKSVVSGMSRQQYGERSMQHQEGCICSTSRRLCSVKCTVSESLICSRKTGCVVGEEVCSIRNVTSAVFESEVFSTKRNSCTVRRMLCSVRRKCTVSEGYIFSRKTACVVGKESLQY